MGFSPGAPKPPTLSLQNLGLPSTELRDKLTIPGDHQSDGPESVTLLRFDANREVTAGGHRKSIPG
jgi:hypothetical protein